MRRLALAVFVLMLAHCTPFSGFVDDVSTTPLDAAAETSVPADAACARDAGCE